MKKQAIAIMLGVSLLGALAGCGADHDEGRLEVSKDVEFGEKDYERIVGGVNELGFKLLHEVDPDETGNLFISPMSLMMALGMVYNGAEGETKEGIAKALQLEGIDPADLNRANASLMNVLAQKKDGIQLSVANSIWLNDSYQFQEQFAARNEDYFNAELQEIDIQSDDAAQRINQWVSDKTNKKINKMVNSPLDQDLVSLLLNAIYFKGDWAYPFKEEDTEERTFHTGDSSIEVPFMKLSERLDYMAGDRFEAIRLPYGEGEMSMTIVLPDEDTDFAEFQSTWDGEGWKSLNDGLEKREGTILMPKFKMAYATELNETLQALGMDQAFQDDADFSLMVEGDASLAISKVLQKTYIDVNEKGTEAAAVTGVSVTESAPAEEPFVMEVNRPFWFAIQDGQTGTILFTGAIREPVIE